MSDESTIITECPYCNTAMDITAVAPFARVACPSCKGEMRVKVRFGPYQLERRLAIGGMSVVFVARDTLLDREVAVKILNEDYSADEKRITAFEEEARITASLSHPNIVRVLTTGRAFGRFFIAMELVTGGHFEHHIREMGKVPEKKMLKLAIQIANGLKAAKAANLIHRDIKPGNILLDANGNAKIVDFGLALVTQGGKAQAKEFWATPYYVPPETIDGVPEDFRADVYAFGATLYHALAGKPPCNEESMATDVLRAAKKQIVPLRQADPGLSGEICRIVDKAMAYEPAKRHMSYDELLRELQTALKHLEHGVDGEGTGADASARRSRRERNQRVTRAAAILVAGVAAISGLAWILGSKSDPVATGDVPADNGSPAVSAPVDTADLGKLHEDARQSISRRSFGAATDRFVKLHSDPRVLEPTRTWAGVQAVVAALLDEDHERAKQLAVAARVHASKVEDLDPSIRMILQPLFARLEEGKPIPIESVDPAASGPAALIASLIIGVLEWQGGGHLEAAAIFEATAKIALDEPDRWASIYQDVAYDHLADLALLESPVYLDDPVDLVAAVDAVERMKELRKQVRMRGPIGGILDERMNELGRIKRKYEHEAEEAANQSHEPGDAPPDTEPEDEPEIELTDPFQDPPPFDPPPDEVERPDREAVAGLLGNYQFGRARRAMDQLDDHELGTRQRTVWKALSRSADAFFDSLREEMESKEFDVTQVKLKSGKIVETLRTGSENGLADADGRIIPWADVHPDAYIDWHRARARRVTDEAERNRLHQEAIAFDLLAGDRQRARTAIERLCENDPNLDRYWSFILENLPK